MAERLPIPPQPSAPQRPAWVPVSTVVGAAVVIFGTFAGCLIFGEEGILHSSDVYPMAIADANASPCVVAKLGQPITGRGTFEGDLGDDDDEDGAAHLEIPLQGPRGNARMTLVAKMHEDKWEFSTLTVDSHDGAPIQLKPTPSACEHP